MDHSTTPKSFKNKELSDKTLFHSTIPIQGRLALSIEKEGIIDGIEMGVLTDGTAYLTARGLAKLCDIDHGSILDIGANWSEELQNPKVTKIKELLYRHKHDIYATAFIPVQTKNGFVHAYPDTICAAVLEYYAFEAGRFIKEVAKQNYRLLAGIALRDYIYERVGHVVIKKETNNWLPLLERLEGNAGAVPVGYFSAFKESVDLAVALGEAGLHVDTGFIHDISVGTFWSKHWVSNSLSSSYGDRIKYQHQYPKRFEQHLSNPQECWTYPESALPAFRKWMREDYIGGGKLHKYLVRKVKDLKLPLALADKAVDNFKSKFLPTCM